jgi:ribonuclease R
MNSSDNHHKIMLERIARRVMLERGLLPDYSDEVCAELARIQFPAKIDVKQVRDLRNLLWCSIDNDDSLDLDQLSVAEQMPGGNIKIFIAVADVDAIVTNGTAIDAHARHNTTSVYTAGAIFAMLPEKLSTNLTSLNLNEDRLSIVIEFIVKDDGSLQESDIYHASVQNHAKLAYNSVAAWLEGNGKMPEAIGVVQGLEENLRLQDKAAQRLKNLRYLGGALNFETLESKAIFENDKIRDLEVRKSNRATDIIEDFMIAANGVVARYLASKKFPALGRVVRIPKRWDRIVEIARMQGFTLPDTPDSKQLDKFLQKEKAADPLTFPDLSLSIIKLMGAGEYVAEFPGETAAPGHFALAVKDYSHSTAPNRRYPDIITQRLLKAVLSDSPAPYGKDELEALAMHCTEQEDAAKKVERQLAKSAAALLLESRIGERFYALVTGAAPKGTWIRLIHTAIEGKLVHGFEGVDVGDRIRVKLIHVDIEQGFIDFARIK